MALAPGSRLGSYEILAQIGAGGMGEVYKARDPKLDRFVAIKILPPSLAEDGDRLARFEREAKAIAALSHPNVLGIFDFGKDGDITYAVMELLEGTSLRDLMSLGPMVPKKAVELAQQIAQGLAAAHAKGIVHRDIKPENIFITLDGMVKVLDFGLVKQLQPGPGLEDIARVANQPTEALPAARAGLTEAGMVMGTVGYMSPEQVLGEAVDHRSDIFAFGVLLYEMLSGRRAFSGPTATETLLAVLRDEPPPLASPAGPLPPSLERTLRHCLEKSPDHRFQSMKDLIFDLSSASGMGSGDGLRGVRLGWKQARIPLVAGAVLLLGALSVFIVRPSILASVGVARDPRAVSPSIAVLPFADMSQSRDQEYFSEGLSEELLNLLAKTPNLRVVARTSSFSFKGKNADVATIAKALNVSNILEGSIRKSGDRIRITAQLIRASDSSHLWSETYDRKVTDLFDVQDEIANAVVDALKLKLLPTDRPSAAKHHVPKPEAYDQYLQGRQFLISAPSGYAQCIQAFKLAVALDPDYAQAYAALAMAENFAAENEHNTSLRAQGQKRAMAAAEQAILLDPRLGDAFATRGFLRYVDEWDWSGAEADFVKALELDPNDGRTLLRFGLLQTILGRLPEGIGSLRRATELEPLFSPAWAQLGRTEAARGDFRAARQALNRSNALTPGNRSGSHYLAVISLLEGRSEAAKGEFATFSDEEDRLWGIAMTEHSLGHPEASGQALNELIARFPSNSYRIATAFAWRGEPDQAFAWLEKALAQRSPSLNWIKVDPMLKNLRKDLRYAKLIERMGLPL
jgi:serine/threonine-protein kinase